MRAVWAVALNTWREVIRDRVLLLMLLFAALVVASSSLLASMTFSEERKIVLDVGLASMEALGVLLALFVGGQLLFKETERRTLYVVLSKPVSRFAFVAGKFLGLAGVQGVLVLAMTLVLLVLSACWGGARPDLLGVAWMLGLQLAILASLSLLGSALTSPLVASALTGVLYLVGHNLETLRTLARKLSPGVRPLVDGLIGLLPDLGVFEVKNAWVHGVPIAWGDVGLASGYAALYAAACVLAAGWLLEWREW
jgi:ABC-type transport system involved in multi-copper enzyme maturation permease subunit